MKAMQEAAFTDMVPHLGPSVAVDRVLEQMRQGVHTATASIVSASLWDHHALQGSDEGLSTGGAAVEDHITHRRHGNGQAEASSTFRQFHADMVMKYGDIALEGIEKFITNPDHAAVSALKIHHSVYGSVAGMWGFWMPG